MKVLEDWVCLLRSNGSYRVSNMLNSYEAVKGLVEAVDVSNKKMKVAQNTTHWYTGEAIP